MRLEGARPYAGPNAARLEQMFDFARPVGTPSQMAAMNRYHSMPTNTMAEREAILQYKRQLNDQFGGQFGFFENDQDRWRTAVTQAGNRVNSGADLNQLGRRLQFYQNLGIDPLYAAEHAFDPMPTPDSYLASSPGGELGNAQVSADPTSNINTEILQATEAMAPPERLTLKPEEDEVEQPKQKKNPVLSAMIAPKPAKKRRAADDEHPMIQALSGR